MPTYVSSNLVRERIRKARNEAEFVALKRGASVRRVLYAQSIRWMTGSVVPYACINLRNCDLHHQRVSCSHWPEGPFMPKRSNRSPRLNPISILRRQLGTPAKALSSETLGALVNITGASLRSIELGRWQLTKDTLQRLRNVGATWDANGGRWFFTYNPKLELTADHLKAIQHFSAGTARFRDNDRRALCLRVLALIDKVPREA